VCPKECPPNPVLESKDRLISSAESGIGRHLLPTECLVSRNTKHHFCFEADGNVVLYQDGKSIWNSGSGGLPTQDVGQMFLDDEDGDLVAEYASSTTDNPIDFWVNIPDETSVDTGAPFTAVMKDDGNFEIIRGDGTVIWSTKAPAQGGESLRLTCD
jgi:hypothetical protein